MTPAPEEVKQGLQHKVDAVAWHEDDYFGAIAKAAIAIIDHYEQRIAELEAKVPRWIPVSERLPESGQWVLFHGLNVLGKHQICSGYYAQARTLEATEDWPEECCDIEGDGAVWWQKEGWYESPHEVEQCAIVEGVTHWQPLPSPPTETTDSAGEQA